MGVIIFFNILFFILSFVKARRIRRNLINLTNRQDSKRHDDNSQWFVLSITLYLINKKINKISTIDNQQKTL